MKRSFFQPQWGWFASGVAMGICFLLATLLVKPIGVSTQFVIFDGILWDAVDHDLVVPDGNAKHHFSSQNQYLNKGGGKYASKVASPLNYGFVFVLAMIAGGLLGKVLSSATPTSDSPVTSSNGMIPAAWYDRYGDSRLKRFFGVFAGGFLVLVGARLAGGCTSGHMMSGMMQTSLSGYLFALGAFAIAIPVAIMMYRVNHRSTGELP